MKQSLQHDSITKTCLYHFDPLKPHFYIVKLGFTGVYIIFLISAQNIDCGYSLEPPHMSFHVFEPSNIDPLTGRPYRTKQKNTEDTSEKTQEKQVRACVCVYMWTGG